VIAARSIRTPRWIRMDPRSRRNKPAAPGGGSAIG
jgi:hypothetical protein